MPPGMNASSASRLPRFVRDIATAGGCHDFSVPADPMVDAHSLSRYATRPNRFGSSRSNARAHTRTHRKLSEFLDCHLQYTHRRVTQAQAEELVILASSSTHAMASLERSLLGAQSAGVCRAGCGQSGRPLGVFTTTVTPKPVVVGCRFESGHTCTGAALAPTLTRLERRRPPPRQQHPHPPPSARARQRRLRSASRGSAPTVATRSL